MGIVQNGKAQVSQSPPWWQIALIGRRPRRTCLRVVILATVCILGSKFVLVPVRVAGISMLPTYRDGGVRLVNRLAYVWHGPQRGDVVAIRLAGPHVMYLKRVVGLPGETVGFREGRLLVNGKPMEEPYVKLPYNWEMDPVNIGPNEYYVVGDNRSMPAADHTKGKAERMRIMGKVLL